MERDRKRRNGFTLIEIAVTVAIVGVLASIAVPTYRNYLSKLRSDTAAADIRLISAKLKEIVLENPSSLPENQPSLKAYLGNARIPFMDPWGRPYEYLRIYDRPGNLNQARKDHNLHPINTFFDLYSRGPDGQSAKPLTSGPSQDDIIYANDGAYIGKVSSFPDL